MLKRGIDIVLSGVALAALSPILLLTAVAVVSESGFPVFYGQWRVGRGFRRFRIWKFRSMRTSQSGPPITTAGDNRITRVGRFIRRTKLDELPQLWNVLKGDMSLVGPRPELPAYVARYRMQYERILGVRPGITDPASLAFHNEERLLALFADPTKAYVENVLPAKLQLSETYVLRCTVWHDLCILFRTVLAVVGWVKVGDRLPVHHQPVVAPSQHAAGESQPH